MASMDNINIVTVASASESYSQELDALAADSASKIEELQHQVTKEKRKLLSFQMKMRSKKKGHRQGRLTKSASQNKLTRSFDAGGGSGSGTSFLEQGRKLDADCAKATRDAVAARNKRDAEDEAKAVANAKADDEEARKDRREAEEEKSIRRSASGKRALDVANDQGSLYDSARDNSHRRYHERVAARELRASEEREAPPTDPVTSNRRERKEGTSKFT